MLKRFLLICTMAFAISASAQFEIDDDTLYAYGYAGANSSSFADLYTHTKLKHTAMSMETIKWTRTTNSLPTTDWTSAVCDIISCRGVEVDTGSFQIGNLDSGELSFHFYPKNIRGNATMVVRFYRESNPMDYADVTIMCQAWKALRVETVDSDLLSVYPNPSKDFITVNNSVVSSGEYQILNSYGQIVATNTFVNGMTISTTDLSSGVYSIVVRNGDESFTKQFIRE